MIYIGIEAVLKIQEVHATSFRWRGAVHFNCCARRAQITIEWELWCHSARPPDRTLILVASLTLVTVGERRVRLDSLLAGLAGFVVV